MAIITPGGKGKRLPSFRGRVVISTRNGKVYARSWPRKRGKPKTVEEFNRQERFRQANMLAKYADPRQQALSRCTMRHLPVRPMDALLAAMAGRLWSIQTDDMGELFSMAARSDVSKNLDIICQQEGRFLIRGPKVWGCFPWGEVDQYIASQGEDTPPIWKDLPAPGGNGGGGAGIIRFAAGDRIGQSSARHYSSAHLRAAFDDVASPSPRAMTIQNLTVALHRTPDAGGSLIVTFWKNDAATPLTVTFAPGDLLKIDTVNTVSLAEGDLFTIKAEADLLGASTWINTTVEAT